MTFLRICCDTTWEIVPADQDGQGRWLAAEPEIPLTPRAAAWTAPKPQPRPNPLASALLGFLQLPIRQLTGPVLITGYRHGRPRPLDAQQLHALTGALHALLTMPDYLALHAQAGRHAATWSRPTNERSSL